MNKNLRIVAVPNESLNYKLYVRALIKFAQERSVLDVPTTNEDEPSRRPDGSPDEADDA